MFTLDSPDIALRMTSVVQGFRTLAGVLALIRFPRERWSGPLLRALPPLVHVAFLTGMQPGVGSWTGGQLPGFKFYVITLLALIFDVTSNYTYFI